MKLERIGITVVAGTFAALASVGCEAPHGQSISQPPAAQAAHQAPTQAELDAFTKTLSPLLSRSAADVRVVKLANGVERATIDKGFQNVILAHRNADGTLSRTCVDSEEQAQAFLAAPPPPTLEVR